MQVIILTSSLQILVGNAAFHSASCYRVLGEPITVGSSVSAVSALGKALSDPEEKTRCNAAGALGNFVRHDGQLAPLLVSLGVVKKLMSVVCNDEAISAKVIKYIQTNINIDSNYILHLFSLLTANLSIFPWHHGCL